MNSLICTKTININILILIYIRNSERKIYILNLERRCGFFQVQHKYLINNEIQTLNNFSPSIFLKWCSGKSRESIIEMGHGSSIFEHHNDHHVCMITTMASFSFNIILCRYICIHAGEYFTVGYIHSPTWSRPRPQRWSRWSRPTPKHCSQYQ